MFFTILVIFISFATSQKSSTSLYENVCNDVHDKKRCLKLAEYNPKFTVGIFYDIPIILCGQISLYNYISYLSIRSLN